MNRSREHFWSLEFKPRHAGNGVFAISSACHRRRRIAASRWTLRVEKVRKCEYRPGNNAKTEEAQEHVNSSSLVQHLQTKNISTGDLSPMGADLPPQL